MFLHVKYWASVSIGFLIQYYFFENILVSLRLIFTSECPIVMMVPLLHNRYIFTNN